MDMEQEEHGKLVFVDLRDETGIVPVAVKAGTADQNNF